MVGIPIIPIIRAELKNKIVKMCRKVLNDQIICGGEFAKDIGTCKFGVFLVVISQKHKYF